jgi:DNA-directed RNA polymerase specialized sigma24 family protein
MKELRDLVNQAQSAQQPAEQMAAFAELVKRFRSMACAYAFSILGDLHLAEDAAQDAFVLAFERLRQLRQAEGCPSSPSLHRNARPTVATSVSRAVCIPTAEGIRHTPTTGPSNKQELLALSTSY